MEKTNVAKQIGSRWLILANSSVLTSIIEFTTTLLIVRFLSPEDYGLLSLALGVIFFAEGLTLAGLDTALIYYTQKFIAARNRSGEKNTIISTLVLKGASAFGVSAILFILGKTIAVDLYSKPELIPLLMLGSGLLLTTSILNTLTSIYLAYKKHAESGLIMVVASTTKLLFSGAFLYYIHTPLAAIGAYLLSRMFIVVLAAYLMRKMLPNSVWHFDSGNAKNIFEYGMQSYFIAVGKTISERVGLLYLGLVATSAIIGYFSFAYAIASALMVIATALSTTLFPYLSEFTAVKKTTEIETAINLSIKYILFIIMPFIFVMPLIGEKVSAFLGKPEYVGSGPFLSILLWMVMFRSLAMPLSTLMQSLNVQKQLIKNVTYMVSAQIATMLIIYNSVGGLAVAYGFLTGYLVLFLLNARSLRNSGFKLKINFLPYIASSLILYYAAELFIKTYGLSSITNTMILGVLGVSSYLVASYTTGGISRRDIEFIKRNVI